MSRALCTVVVLVAPFGLATAGACIIADPPAEIPVPPLERPEILHEEVVPPATTILNSWPLEFIVPIDVPDPTSAVEWRAFLDYDPIQNTHFYAGNPIDPDPASADAGVRVLSATLPVPDLDACHTIEIVVALSFVENHTPDSVGGDSVAWFYSPTGSLDSCPTFDAGPFDAASPVDASDSSLDDGGAD